MENPAFRKHNYPMFRRPAIAYRGGGLRNMMQQAAGQGRFGDNQLMHVSSDELRGLSALAPGGRLTRNPHTGLPEAFSLGDLLGPVLGLAGTFAAPWLGISSALAGGLGAGVGTAIGTGDVQKGLGAGLLSYGLGSALGHLADAGEAAATPAAAAPAPAPAAPGLGSSVPGTATAAERAIAPPVSSAGSATAADRAMGYIPNAPSTNPIDRFGMAMNGISQLGALKNAFIGDWMNTSLPIGAGALLQFGSGGHGAKVPGSGFGGGGSGSYPEQGPRDRFVNPAPDGYQHGFMPEWRFLSGPGYAGGGEVGGLRSFMPASNTYGHGLFPEWDFFGNLNGTQPQQNQNAASGLPFYQAVGPILNSLMQPYDGANASSPGGFTPGMTESSDVSSESGHPSVGGISFGQAIGQSNQNMSSNPALGFAVRGLTALPGLMGIPSLVTAPLSLISAIPGGMAGSGMGQAEGGVAAANASQNTSDPAATAAAQATDMGLANPVGLDAPSSDAPTPSPTSGNDGVDGPDGNLRRGGMVRRYADGGDVSMQAQSDQVVQDAVAAMEGGGRDPAGALMRFARMYGKDALYRLWARVSGGGLEVEGMGDGLSDDVPATIEGQKPARLSDGEYVVPADAVSGLGNGSTRAGVRQLEDMVNKVRYQRHGSAEQPGPINPQEVMP